MLPICGDSPAEKQDEVKQTAGFAALYSVAVEAVDGKRCKDASAPGGRMEQFAPALRPILAYVKTLPVDTRRLLVNLVMKLDARTMDLPARHADWFLCSGGLDQIQYGLTHGAPKPVPTAPGHIGQTVTVDGKGYEPKFLTDEASSKAVAEARAHLASTMNQLAGL